MEAAGSPESPAFNRRASQDSDFPTPAQAIVIDVAQVGRLTGYPIRYPRRPGSYGTLQVVFAAFFFLMGLSTGNIISIFWFLMALLQCISVR